MYEPGHTNKVRCIYVGRHFLAGLYTYPGK